ncbi:MAG: fibronectin type III domain-containing protein [Saprospiraceae bacterium]|nr:fibronectin type III domain-containing protein [Saprospiraceae bacterium]
MRNTILSFVLLFANFLAVSASACPTPTNLTVTNTTGTEATLSWDAVPGAISYWVEVEQTLNNPILYHVETTVTTTSYAALGLNPGTFYKFKVRTNCGNDKSDWSEWQQFGSGTTTGGGGTGGGGTSGCAVPSGLTMQASGSTSAILSWGAVAGVTTYQIEVEDASGNPTSFKDTATVTGTSYTVTGLLAGMPYKFKVRSKCGGSHSDWTGWAYFVADVNGSVGGGNTGGGGNNGGGNNSSCAKPTGMLALNVTISGADLQWTAVAGAIGYTIEVESAQKMNNPFHLEQNITTNSFSVSGLVPGKLYKFKVRTRCSSSGKNRSGWTNWVFFSTPTSFTDDNASDREQMPQENVFSIRLYPNPVSDALYVQIEGAPASSTELRLFDLNGQLVMQELTNTDQQTAQLNLSALNPGMYLLQVLSGENQEVRKVLVTR